MLVKSLEKNLKRTIKITPETYEKMNEVFEKEGTPLRIKVPTQDQINEWQKQNECSP
jgi:hypothetical protein